MWILNYDKALPYKDVVVHEFFAKDATNVIDQVPHSPEMAPCDIYGFLIKGSQITTPRKAF